jgi:hypothetical protein
MKILTELNWLFILSSTFNQKQASVAGRVFSMAPPAIILDRLLSSVERNNITTYINNAKHSI